ncbi:MAG: TetR/AcrR family transcriptional regulator [Lachnospiraceae bacterium]
MPKKSEERINARREEIISACEELYKVMNFKDITLKEIGNVTTFTRTSIYNYFETKEEIFLAMLKREYELWNTDLKKLLEENETMFAVEFAWAMAHSLESRELMLKLLAMNHYDIETNSRLEMLTEYKKVCDESVRTLGNCLEKFFPHLSQNARQGFLAIFLPFMYGIYPYTVANEKQQKAMQQAGVECSRTGIFEITYNCVKRLLN